MSGKKSKSLRFLDYRMTPGQANCVASVIEMTTGRFGLHKRYFKTEPTFWRAVEQIVGMKREADESFFGAVNRIHQYLKMMPRERRAEIVGAVDRNALFSAAAVRPEDVEVLATTIILPRSETVKKPRAPRPLRDPSIKRGKPSVASKKGFYASWEWRELRLKVIKEHGRECQCCGNRPGMLYASGDPVRIVVDHIKPLSKHWHLRLDRSNLQVLCDECNQGKGNWDETDFRSPETSDEWIEGPQDDIALTVLAELSGKTVQ